MSDKPDYTPMSNEAEWHITYKCDLNCPNCNRLCFLPPTTPDMTLDDAREFNRQARELGWFPKIVILGGEPTLHRDLFAFIDIANELSPGRVEIWSNGYRDAAKEQLARIRAEAKAKVCEETIKADGCMVLPQADFFLAPTDFGVINHRPCHNHAAIGCGISVDACGYAVCSIGGAIDSVLDLKVRTKELKDLFDPDFAHQQTCALCDVCGREYQPSHRQEPGDARHTHVADLAEGSQTHRAARQAEGDVGVNPFATHMPALLACLEHTSGPVLELGSGWFSTPIVSAFATDRLVRTIETNPEWYIRVSGLGIYQPITQHRHQFLFVPDYNDAPILDQHWDVVILDHEPPPRRGHDALVLRDRCRLMIGHDSEHPDYRYAEAFDQFRYRFTDSRRLPWTTVVSDEPLNWLADALQFPGGLA